MRCDEFVIGFLMLMTLLITFDNKRFSLTILRGGINDVKTDAITNLFWNIRNMW